MAKDALRIGCGCGFWGDSASGPAQLVRDGNIDVLALDYLSEITLSLLARARARRPEAGYTADFVNDVVRPLAPELAARRIRVVTNAGGVNPRACRDAVRALLAELGVPLAVAAVLGDDISGELDALRQSGVRDLESDGPLPAQVVSANAYLGAFPIAQALDAGADVVITGRCADSALALGPLIHRFGWSAADLDALAMGSLAGHIIECGPQATGGIFTDWREVAAGWHDMGYPIAECTADGSFVVTKPAGSGGRVTRATVAEQVTYEVHDPRRYVLPDVVCDFSAVQLEDLGADRVRVTGARGRPATPWYKASLTYADGYRCTATLMIVGPEAAARARHAAAAILARTRKLLATRGYGDYRAVSVEVLGAEDMYGPHARTRATREVILKIAVAHGEERALELFAREIYPSATSMAQGITGFAAGRPAAQPIVRLASCLVPKTSVHVSIETQGGVIEVAAAAVVPATVAAGPVAPAAPAVSGSAAGDAGSAPTGPWREVPLLRLAHGRSGDKGDTANIGVLARRPEFVPLLAQALTPQAVRAWLAHLVEGEVERFDWPGLDGWNFVLRRALGGGGVASLRYDPQGKSYAQILMDLPVRVPQRWLQPGGLLGEAG
jgi:acyclic terpene utilization AtuA family protein